jgi:hypothetical protein
MIVSALLMRVRDQHGTSPILIAKRSFQSLKSFHMFSRKDLFRHRGMPYLGFSPDISMD